MLLNPWITQGHDFIRAKYVKQRQTPDLEKRTLPTHRVRDSSSLSKVPCRRSSSIIATVTSFSLSLDSFVDIGGVTPR